MIKTVVFVGASNMAACFPLGMQQRDSDAEGLFKKYGVDVEVRSNAIPGINEVDGARLAQEAVYSYPKGSVLVFPTLGGNSIEGRRFPNGTLNYAPLFNLANEYPGQIVCPELPYAENRDRKQYNDAVLQPLKLIASFADASIPFSATGVHDMTATLDSIVLGRDRRHFSSQGKQIYRDWLARRMAGIINGDVPFYDAGTTLGPLDVVVAFGGEGGKFINRPSKTGEYSGGRSMVEMDQLISATGYPLPGITYRAVFSRPANWRADFGINSKGAKTGLPEFDGFTYCAECSQGAIYAKNGEYIDHEFHGLQPFQQVGAEVLASRPNVYRQWVTAFEHAGQLVGTVDTSQPVCLPPIAFDAAADEYGVLTIRQFCEAGDFSVCSAIRIRE